MKTGRIPDYLHIAMEQYDEDRENKRLRGDREVGEEYTYWYSQDAICH